MTAEQLKKKPNITAEQLDIKIVAPDDAMDPVINNHELLLLMLKEGKELKYVYYNSQYSEEVVWNSIHKDLLNIMHLGIAYIPPEKFRRLRNGGLYKHPHLYHKDF